jgi:hypothetical protein
MRLGLLWKDAQLMRKYPAMIQNDNATTIQSKRALPGGYSLADHASTADFVRGGEFFMIRLLSRLIIRYDPILWLRVSDLRR